MSSVPKNNKIKKLLEVGSKKSIRKYTKDELDQNKNNKSKEKEKEKEKNLKILNKKLSDKIITNEPIEKEMLKGQEHKEEVSKEEKGIMEPNNNNTNIINSIEIPSLIPTKEKEIIIIKPKEKYLKDKMSKMNYSEKLISSINKSLDNQVKTIQSEIMDNQVLITAISKNANNNTNINSIINKSLPPESLSSDNLLFQRSPKNYATKTKLKALKDLKEEQEKIKNNLKQLIENEKLIKDESFTKLYSLKQSQSNLSLDKILKIEKLKKIESQKNTCMDKINEIEFRINELINNNEFSRRSKLKTFIENFERDKELAEIRAKKYYKESKRISLRMEKDIKQIIDKVKKELDEKEKEEEKKKLDMLEDFKKKEKAIEQKRYKAYMKKAMAFKNYISEKPKLKIKDYLFSKNEEKFLEEEAKVILLENNKRKAYMKSVTKEELKEFAHNFNENKEKFNTIKEEKKIKLFSEWKERKGLLPTYVSCFSETANIESKKIEEEEKQKEERIHSLIKLRKDFSNQIKEEKQPPISKKLMQKRLDEINRLENPKLFIVKDTLSKRKKKRILLKKRDPTKPSRFKWKLKLEEDPFDKMNKSETVNNTLIRRPKKIRVSSSFENKEHKPLDRKIDYLREMTIKREKRSNILSQPKSTAQKWDKIMNNFEGNIIENVNNVKQKADYLEKEAHIKEKILNMNGGIENNPELGQKVSSLLIDSIEAKLSILSKITQEKNKK